MSSALVLGLVGGLLVVAFLANRVFGLTRIPDVLVLMMLGVVLGPVLGLVQAGALAKTTNLLGTLAIILVLFEGGLELNLRDTLKHFPGSFLLATLAYVFSTVLVAVIVTKGLGLSWTDGLLVGAVLGCTSSTVVLPVLQQLQAEEPVRVTLMLEASWGDVLAVLTVGLLLGMRSQGGAVAQGLAHGLLNQVGIALLFTIPAGILWSRLLHVLSEQRFWQVLTFSIVLVLYAGMEALGANGLIAVLGFGLTLSNFPGVDPGLGLSLPVTQMAESQQALLTFHSELAFLVRTFFFVMIGAIAQLGIFREHPLLMAGTLGSLFLARWLAIHSSSWAWRGIAAHNRELIFWVLPRGLITVVLAIEVAEQRGSGLAFVPGLAFAVILVTNALLILASFRARRAAPVSAAAPAADIALDVQTLPGAPVHPRRRWVLNAVMLFLLALGGLVLWYGNHPERLQPQGVVEWIKVHLHRGN
ncbi:MAG: cation:proton antiporter [Terriglobales bacterium]